MAMGLPLIGGRLVRCGVALALALAAPRAGAAPGDLDPSFGDGGSKTTPFGESFSTAYALVLQPDGKLVAAGYVSPFSSTELGLARYDVSGTLDPTFGTEGLVTTPVGVQLNVQGLGLGLQPDGKLVVAGATNGEGQDILLARYDPDGSPDSTFGEEGIVT